MRTLIALLLTTTVAAAQTTVPMKPAAIAVQPMTAPPAPVRKIALGPAQYDKRPEGQVLHVVRMSDLGAIKLICKSEFALACSVFNARECLVLLGPPVHNDPRALQHELQHCGLWPADHPGSRFD